MLEILQRCFPQHMEAWEPKIKEMIPSYGISLVENLDLLKEVHSSTAKALGLSDEKHVLHV
ncbi:putative malate:quinone oxidoreductase 2 [compost metagenome]|jgi:malate dehydrogenase (quinone)